MKESQNALDVPHLQRLLARRDHELFLAAFENAAAPRNDFLQALGGEGLFLLLAESEAPDICRSVFRSQQERIFLRALSLRFPGLQALPNYPLDQIVELERVA